MTLDDVLFASDAGEVKPTTGLSVSAEILTQGRGDKVIVFKKRRRHNYRRRNGHRQSLTVLKILAVGAPAKAAPKKAAAAPVEAAAEAKPAKKPAAKKAAAAE